MLLRLLKLMKLVKLFSYSENILENRIVNFFSINAGKMRLLILLMTIHLCGCGWYYIAKLEDFSPAKLEDFIRGFLVLISWKKHNLKSTLQAFIMYCQLYQLLATVI